MNDGFNKYSNEEVNKDREKKDIIEKERHERNSSDNNQPINRETDRRNVDSDYEDGEKKGLLDKIVDFFNPDDDSERTNRDQNHDTLDRDDSFGRDSKDTGMMESDRDTSDSEKVLVGIFENENEAINVITRLNQIGYWEDDITAVTKDKHQIQEGTDKVGVGAAGSSLGGMAMALPAFGLIEIPGVGPILAAGPITGLMGSNIVGGASNELVGGLVQMGVREEEAKEYEQYIQQGKILILVENRDHTQEDVNSTFTQNNSLISDRSRSRELAGIMR